MAIRLLAGSGADSTLSKTVSSGTSREFIGARDFFLGGAAIELALIPKHAKAVTVTLFAVTEKRRRVIGISHRRVE